MYVLHSHQSVGNSDQRLADRVHSLSLYMTDIPGDGNCMFHALSEQLYGVKGEHKRVRKDIINFLKERKEDFAPFIDEDQFPKGISGYLKEMKKDGTYGTHLELSVCATMYARQIVVVQPDYILTIDPLPWIVDKQKSVFEKHRKSHAVGQGPLFVAYHEWEHYSGLRMVSGPHTGLPNISIDVPDARPPSGAKMKQKSPNYGDIHLFINSLPPMLQASYSPQKARRLIDKHGSWDSAAEHVISSHFKQ